MQISGKTDVGLIRANNQDSFAAGELPSGGSWAVVCDGMGGHAGGHIASKMAVECIEERIKNNFYESMSVQSVRNMLESAVLFANTKVFDSAAKYRELKGMGTTVVAAMCFGDVAVIACVGDSRCYHLEHGKITQITKDHSLVQELVDSGNLTPEEANEHPMKNIITRALGLEEDVQVDFFEITTGASHEHKEKEMLLLCTDGLTNLVSDEEIAGCLLNGNSENADSLDLYTERLVELAKENGGTDNITAVIIALD